MRLDFFPSRRLTTYLAKTFVVRIAAVLVMLVVVLQALDLLSQTGNILAQPGNGQAEVLQYVSLRAPQLVARFLPYSVLLATIITLATLNANSEVIAMKAAGLSAHQILAPLVLTAGVISAISFTFNETVVTRASAKLQAWDAVDFGPIPTDEKARTNAYFTSDDDILMARLVSGEGDDITLSGVTFYERGQGGAIVRQFRADRATYANPGWALEQPTRFDVGPALSVETPETFIVAERLTPAQIMLGKIDPDATPAGELSDHIDALDAAGRRTAELKGAWWHKFSGPLSALLMPILGAVAAFGLARSGQLFVRAVIGMALGFAYFVVDNAALAMGNFGGYPPLLAAWAPFVLFALIGEAVLIRTEE